MDFQQSQTFINLQSMYEYELQASTLFNLFSIKATEENLIQIAFLFDTISRNERFVAERLRNLLLVTEPNTLQNLQIGYNNQTEAESKYREYSTVAREEGYEDIAALFNGIANIKLNHRSNLETAEMELGTNQLLCKNQNVLWICLGCGNIMSGFCAPDICPICLYPQGYYQFLSF